ncbi:MAG: mucoidy inhibitor MuiA family protein [Flavobacteriales bacterium]|nr:mucoidy inhibitor MuiA family protein [Flavobacteriales bacterium]
MKNPFVILLACVILAATARAQERTEVKVTSKIEKVTVYFKGAQIGRKGGFSATKGNKYLFRIEGIEPGIVLTSLQIKSPDGISINQIGNEVKYTALENHDSEIEAINKELEKLKFNLEDKNDQIALINVQRAMLDENRNISSTQSGMTVEAWKNGVAYYEEKTSELKLKQRKLEREALVIQTEIQSGMDRLGKITGTAKKQTIDLLVEATCEKTISNGNFLVSYIVPDATWKPKYDLKMKGLDRPLELDVKAEINQSTGSDWKDVDLILTSEDPFTSSEKPELIMWDPLKGYRPSAIRRSTVAPQTGTGKLFGYIKDGSSYEAIPFANVLLKDGDEVVTAVSTDFEGKYTMNDVPAGTNYTLYVSCVGFSPKEREYISVRADQSVQADVVMTANVQLEQVMITTEKSKLASRGRYAAVQSNDGQIGSIKGSRDGATNTYIDSVRIRGTYNAATIAQKTTRIQYEVKSTRSIPSDKEKHTVQLDALDIVASFKHYSAPVELNKAFLISKVVGWEEYNLLDGLVALHVDGTYIGESTLHAGRVADTLVLSLGTDTKVLVNRTKLKEFSKKTVLGGKKIQERSYKLSLKNTRSEAIKAIVQDQIPVSSDKEVEVELLESGNAKLNKETGVLEWEVEIPAGQTWETTFTFSVKYPNEMRVYID